MKNKIYLSSQTITSFKGKSSYLIKTLLLVFGLLASISSFAQSGGVLSGTILDQNKEPIPGATVMLKDDANVGTVCDIEGKFTLDIPGGEQTIVVNFIGMSPKEVKVKAGDVITVSLESSSIQLEEAVVVGYGQQKKKSVVGAITQASGATLEKSGGVTNLGTALTGKLPGVITYSSTGQPGEENPRIVIRTRTSWNGEGGPLILVDGVERSMNDVDISSVANVSVLKDASATAVYGVKGANGVILITTKRGREGKANIQVRANSTVKIPSKIPEKYDAYDTYMLRNRSIEREGAVWDSWNAYMPQGIIDKYRNPANLEEAERYPNIDWADELLKQYAMAYNASVNVSGGTKFVKYFAAVDYLHEGDIFKTLDSGEGYEPGFAFNRVNVRSNLDFQLTKTTTFSSNLFGSNGVKKTPWNFSGNFPWQAIYSTAADAMMPQYADGSWGYYQPHDANQPNSVYMLANNGVGYQTATKITSDFSLKQDLDFVTEGLEFQATYSYDNSFREHQRGINNIYNELQRKWIDPATGEAIYKEPIQAATQLDYVNQIKWTTSAGSVDRNATARRQYYSLRLNYARDFGLHGVTGLALFSREKGSYGNGFPKYREDWVFRTTYNYDSRYLFEFNGAYNGSEQYGPGYRFDFFPSLSLGWMLTEEDFMKSLDFFEMFKIRGSWGLIGDDSATGNERFLYSDQWEYSGHTRLGTTMGNESPYTFYRQTKYGNPDLAWEVVEKKNIGVDYALFDGLVAGSFDYFRDHRTDIVTFPTTPSFVGGKVPRANIGEVKSKGYEFELRLNKKLRNGFRLWANINMNHAVNEVIFSDDPVLLPAYQKGEGYTINQNRSYIDDGYLATWDDVLGSTQHANNNGNKLPGDYNIIDFNGDGVIDTYDSAPYQYSGLPQNSYSTTIGFDWKGVNFNLQFYGVSNVTRDVFFPTFHDSNNNAYVEGSYWTVQDGGDVPLPRYGSALDGTTYGTRYIYDGSYLRIKTAELGYTLTNSFVKRMGMQSCKLYVSGNNLMTWTDLPDDRESNFSGGSSSGAYPTFKRVTFGLDIKF